MPTMLKHKPLKNKLTCKSLNYLSVEKYAMFIHSKTQYCHLWGESRLSSPAVHFCLIMVGAIMKLRVQNGISQELCSSFDQKPQGRKLEQIGHQADSSSALACGWPVQNGCSMGDIHIVMCPPFGCCFVHSSLQSVIG